MPLTKEQKQKIVKNLTEKLEKQKAMVFVAFEGLRAKDIFVLRKRLKAADCLLTVAKKTLLNLVFKENKKEFDTKKMAGQMALIYGFSDEISPAKIAHQFSQENEKLRILGGYFDNQFRNKEDIIALAKVPTRQELLAKLAGSLSAPISGFVSVLQGNIKGLITVLTKIKS